jgi:hypothetical protein
MSRAQEFDDDDMGDLFRAKKAASLVKRADNRASSTDLLVERGVPFASHNLGAHLVVAGKWDFWPGTGKWRERKGIAGRKLREGRGVFNLLDIVAKEAAHG